MSSTHDSSTDDVLGLYSADTEADGSSDQRTEIDDLKWLLSNRRGRRFLRRLLDTTGVATSSFSSDTHAMAFMEGRRVIGLDLEHQLKTYCLDRYVELLKENPHAS